MQNGAVNNIDSVNTSESETTRISGSQRRMNSDRLAPFSGPVAGVKVSRMLGAPSASATRASGVLDLGGL